MSSTNDFCGLLLSASMVLPHHILVIYLNIGYGFLCSYFMPHGGSVSAHAMPMFCSSDFHGIPCSTYVFPLWFLPLPMLFFWFSLISRAFPVLPQTSYVNLSYKIPVVSSQFLCPPHGIYVVYPYYSYSPSMRFHLAISYLYLAHRYIHLAISILSFSILPLCSFQRASGYRFGQVVTKLDLQLQG